MIELRVREVSQLFNTLDPFPFRERDISSPVDQYIVEWAEELPQGQPIQIVVHVQSPANEGAAADISDAIATWYSEKEKIEANAIRVLFRDGRRAFFIGMTLLSACLFLAWLLSQNYQGPFAHLMQESFVIIGWVVIWRPVEIFLYDWIPLMRRRKLYHRLAASKAMVQAPQASGAEARPCLNDNANRWRPQTGPGARIPVFDQSGNEYQKQERRKNHQVHKSSKNIGPA